MKFFHLIVLSGCLIATAALADLKTGDTAWQNGDYTAAISEWRPLAIAGDPDAQVHLGQAYQLGRGVPVDLKLAEDWFRRAAQQGNDEGKDSYGLVLFQIGKRAEALPYVEDAAGRSNPRAQYILGTALFNGDMIAKDWPRAYAMMTRASTAGIPAAKTSLVQMDKYIPLEQRKRGLELAAAFEAHANGKTASLASTIERSNTGGENLQVHEPVAGAPPVRQPKPGMIVTPLKPISVKIADISALKPVAATVDATKPTAHKVQAPKLVAPAPLPSGNWRVQFGAYSDEAKARALWPALRERIPALRPYSAFAIKVGPLTRLRAGPLGSRAAADKLCNSVRAGGQSCIPVAP